jgi:hypothetical protein
MNYKIKKYPEIFIVEDALDYDGPTPYLVEMWLAPVHRNNHYPGPYMIELGMPLGE